MFRWSLLSLLVSPTLSACAQTAAPSPIQPQAANLLLQNSDFESGDGGGYNGKGQIAGWEYQNVGYKFFGVVDGGQNSPKAFALTDGGSLQTARGARVKAEPFRAYRLTFDAKKTRDNFPDRFIGLRAEIQFFDEKGEFLSLYRPPEFLGEAPTDWQTVSFQATAPEKAAFVGIYIDNWQGQYLSDTQNFTNARDVSVDNFHLEAVKEATESLTIRRAPRVLQGGQTAQISLMSRFNEPRKIALQLVDGSKAGKVFAPISQMMGAGRRETQLEFSIPANLSPTAIFRWRAFAADAKNAPLAGVKIAESGGVTAEKIQIGSSLEASDERLFFMGRWKIESAQKRSSTWPGSEIRARFKGTRLQLHADIPAYQDEKNPLELAVVVDGDEKNWRKISLRQGDQSVAVAENLVNAAHTIQIVRISEVTNGPLVVRGFSTDENGGFGAASRPANRKIEFFGDSITVGGTTVPKSPDADPKAGDHDFETNHLFSFGALTARAFDADARFIAKGGMALSGEAFVPFSLPQIWDKLDFSGDVGAAQTANLADWKPDAVVIGIGHNDLFSKGYSEEKFATAYADFVQKLRVAYPDAHIFCTDTTMTFDSTRQWERAIRPLQKTDPKIHFNLFAQLDTGGHPHGKEHRSMALGGGWQQNNLVEWLGDIMGW